MMRLFRLLLLSVSTAGVLLLSFPRPGQSQIGGEEECVQPRSGWHKNVFCVDLRREYYYSIDEAYHACIHKYEQSQEACIIMIEGPSEHDEVIEVRDGNGFIVPYNGDVVLRSPDLRSVLWIFSDHWHVRGNGGFRFTFLDVVGFTSTVTIHESSHVTIGPGVTVESSTSAQAGIEITGKDGMSENQSEGIVIDEVTFAGSGSFDSCISILQENQALPSSSDYRVVVKNSRLANFRSYAIKVRNTWGILFDSNYVYFQAGGSVGVYISGSSHGDYRNSVFEVGTSVVIRAFFLLDDLGIGRPHSNNVRANTFDCGTSTPSLGAIYMDASHSEGWGRTYPPIENHFTNLLLSGSCGDNGDKHLLNCAGGRLDGDTTLTCVRATNSMIYQRCYVTEDHRSCLGDGKNVPISFRRVGSKPFPYYAPKEPYIGVDITRDVPRDYVGQTRKRGSLSIGAIEPYNESASCTRNCSGHGFCLEDATDCFCRNQTEYVGEFCEIPVCGGLPAISADVCSSHGSCTSFDKCECTNTDEFVGQYCEIPVCNGVPAGAGNVCSGLGTCNDFNECNCSNSTAGDFCEIPICNGLSRGTEGACSGRGRCIAPDLCRCHDSYGGEWCSVPLCRGLPPDSPLVCCGRGICEGPNSCVCSDGNNFRGSDCEIWKCADSKWVSDGAVCGRHGNCSASDAACLCDYGWGGLHCSDFKCIDGNLSSSSTTVCSGRGTCSAVLGECACSEAHLWGGPTCDAFVCADDKLITDPKVCFGRGPAQPGGECDCDQPLLWGGQLCGIPRCVDEKLATDATSCNSHGSCNQGGGSCVCVSGYSGFGCLIAPNASGSHAEPMSRNAPPVVSLWLFLSVAALLVAAATALVAVVCIVWFCRKRNCRRGGGFTRLRDASPADEELQRIEELDGSQEQAPEHLEDELRAVATRCDAQVTELWFRFKTLNDRLQADSEHDRAELRRTNAELDAEKATSQRHRDELDRAARDQERSQTEICVLTEVHRVSEDELQALAARCDELQRSTLRHEADLSKQLAKAVGNDDSDVVPEMTDEDKLALRGHIFRGEDTDVFRLRGTGALGRVYEWNRFGRGVVALKLMSPGVDPEQFKKTIEGYQKAKHPNLSRLLSYCLQAPMVIVTPLHHETIWDLIQREELSDFGMRLKIIRETAHGLMHLHACRIVHRDLKWDNVMLTHPLDHPDCHAVVIDFGLIWIRGTSGKTLQPDEGGTTGYIAPELFDEGTSLEFSFPADVFAFAIMMYELLMETDDAYGPELPKDGSTPSAIRAAALIHDGLRPNIDLLRASLSDGNEWLARMIECCWSGTPMDRFTFSQIVRRIHVEEEKGKER